MGERPVGCFQKSGQGNALRGRLALGQVPIGHRLVTADIKDPPVGQVIHAARMQVHIRQTQTVFKTISPPSSNGRINVASVTVKQAGGLGGV